MPRNVRNFWVSVSVDGRRSDVETGPRSKDGGINISILMRDKGSVGDKALRIVGRPTGDGKLHLRAYIEGSPDDLIHLETERDAPKPAKKGRKSKGQSTTDFINEHLSVVTVP